MGRTSIRTLADRLLGGHLDDELARRRLAGDSLADIARWLDDEHDIRVTAETVRAWCSTPAEDEVA